MRPNIFGLLCLCSSLAFTLPVEAETQGNGVVAAPTAAAYADLTNASNKILADVRSAVPKATTILLYDAATFSVIPYYKSMADLVRAAAQGICEADGIAGPRAVVPTVDAGTSAQGLASLIQLTMPSYAIQGQNLALDGSALIGSFATAAAGTGYTVVNPTYLLPAISQNNLTCDKANSSTSLADLWKFANIEAGLAQNRAASKKALKDALDAFQKTKDVLLNTDKGPPILGKALMVESLVRAVEQQAQVAVIDMRLDAADIDSTTKSLLWWRKTRFSANIAAHYWIFSAHGQGEQFALTLVQPGYVNLLRKDVDLKGFALSH